MSAPAENSPGGPESFVLLPRADPASVSTSSADTSFEEIQEDCDGPETGNESVREVLDDVESQIETLREAVTRLGQDKRALQDLLEGVSQSLPVTPLSSVEKEEVVLEVGRLAAPPGHDPLQHAPRD